MKRLLWIIPALMLTGCVAVPYDPYPYSYSSYPNYSPYPYYSSPAPVYVAPSVYFGYGGYWGGGRGGGRWRH